MAEPTTGFHEYFFKLVGAAKTPLTFFCVALILLQSGPAASFASTDPKLKILFGLIAPGVSIILILIVTGMAIFRPEALQGESSLKGLYERAKELEQCQHEIEQAKSALELATRDKKAADKKVEILDKEVAFLRLKIESFSNRALSVLAMVAGGATVRSDQIYLELSLAGGRLSENDVREVLGKLMLDNEIEPDNSKLPGSFKIKIKT